MYFKLLHSKHLYCPTLFVASAVKYCKYAQGDHVTVDSVSVFVDRLPIPLKDPSFDWTNIALAGGAVTSLIGKHATIPGDYDLFINRKDVKWLRENDKP